MGSSLPHYEANLFNSINESYKTEDYEKGLKAADAILKRFPNHGETLSMKGLLLNCMDRKSEAYDFAHEGLKNGIQSHVCWHVYGLLYRSDRVYENAVKCYRNALKIDPDNLGILRDLSLVQVQVRKGSASILCDNDSKQVKMLEAWEETLADEEVLLYKIALLEECGFLQRALQELQKNESKIVDKLAIKEQQVSLLVKLKSFNEGEKIYRELISQNPDCYRYYAGLQICLGLSSVNGHYSNAKIEKLDVLYKSLREQYSCAAVKRIPLDFLEGKKFLDAADVYIRSLLTQGVPSLFSDLCPLYEHPGKVDIIEQLILKLESSIKTTGGYPGSTKKEPPSTLLWTFILLAQHYDRCGQHALALGKIDEAIKHNPTVIHIYSVEHAGHLTAAAAMADKARRMDLADHLLNRKCVKRMLQADQGILAEKTALLVKQIEGSSNNLHDLWYELASGDSYFRQGDFLHALKKFLAVEKHCADMSANLFDFRSYCLTKLTLRTNVKMHTFQDHLLLHSYFHKAAAGIIRCYMKLYDSTSKVADQKYDETSKLLLSPKTTASGGSKSGKGQPAKLVSMDFSGVKLLQSGVVDPLLEATKYLKLLQRSSSESLETYLLSFELNMRKNKILLALQAVMNLFKLDCNSPDTHRCLIRFLSTVYSMPVPVTYSESIVSKVLEAVSKEILSEVSEEIDLLSREALPTRLNEIFLNKHKDSLIHRAAAGEMLFLLEPNKKSEVIKLVEDTPNGALGPLKQWRLKDCISVHKLLGIVLGDLEAASRWIVRCSELFPMSSYFNPPAWILDSGANYHFTSDVCLLHDTKQFDKAGIVRTVDRGATSYSLMGSSFIHSSSPSDLTIHLQEVYVCRWFVVNVISIPELVRQHPYVVEFTCDGYFIRDEKYEDLMSPDSLIACGSIKETGDRYTCMSYSHHIPSKQVTWVLDTGAFSHATADKSILQNVSPCEPGTIMSASGKLLHYEEAGFFVIRISYDDGVSYTLRLERVVVVEGLERNLISVRTLTVENSCSVVFSSGGYYIMDCRNGELEHPDLVRVAGGITDSRYVHVSQLQQDNGRVVHSYGRGHSEIDQIS